jgi:metal-responsive CopG/Arc/MetJ family transcriptional regulator
MAGKTIRTHVILPEELVEAVDELVGHRKRSAYIAEAVEARVAHDRLGKALKEAAGALADADYPEWETPEKTSAWVRELRREADEATERKLSRLRQP